MLWWPVNIYISDQNVYFIILFHFIILNNDMEIVLSYNIGPLCVNMDENVHRFVLRGKKIEKEKLREWERDREKR